MGEMKNFRFHATNESYERYLENSISKALENGTIIQDDADLIKSHVEEIESTRHITSSRAFKIAGTLATWRRFIGPYRDNTKFDLYRAIKNLKSARQENGKPYSANTIADFVRVLKRFYKWMSAEGFSCIDPKDIEKIKNPPINTMTKTAEAMLTEDEAMQILEVCQNSRDRALFSSLYEGGFRIGELANLKWKAVKFKEHHVLVNVDGKTGRPRAVPLIISRPYLAEWKNNYPGKVEEDAFVFLALNSNRPIRYRALKKQLDVLIERAGITKKVTFHLFRHSRITHLKERGLNESEIKLMMWGNLNTDMLSTYMHLSDTHLETALEAIYEIKTPSKKTKPTIAPQQCARCGALNSPTASYCTNCGMPLSGDAEYDVEELQVLLKAIPKDKVVELLSKSLMQGNPSGT
ncbi:site-specific integrase [Methanogenium organophilum]|uniref:Site-specific integrase n=1 Tax=Methanogenium organophilum TaxID=2199 RepID=A0A9X9S3S0_METOG|nr:site-specific integrase [Methanogenium organophilum]WAI00960.1 site-specific integrase [Methanogenium organophilum]